MSLVSIIFIYLESDTTHHIFNLGLVDLLYNLVGIVLGIILGCFIVRKKRIFVNKTFFLFLISGEYFTLFLICLNILMQYAIHTMDYFHIALLYKFAPVFLIAMGVFSGISVGKLFTYIYKYRKAKHRDFKRVHI